jgi:hypothetical protein
MSTLPNHLLGAVESQPIWFVQSATGENAKVGPSGGKLLNSFGAKLATSKRAAPIREAAFASLKAPVRLVRASVDPTDASEEREASGR